MRTRIALELAALAICAAALAYAQNEPGTPTSSGVAGTTTANQGSPAAQSNRWPVFVSDGTAERIGQAAMVSSLPVAIASNQSAVPASQSGAWTVTANAGTGTFSVAGTGTAGSPGTAVLAIQGISGGTAALVTANAGTGTFTVNEAQINGVAPSMGNGISGTGVQRVTLASDSTGQVTLAAGAATIGSLAANQSVNTAQINGVAPLMGNGLTGTGSQRVTIASDNTAFSVSANQGTAAAQSSRWPVFVSNGTAERIGQATMASSLPVAIASDQPAVPVSQSGAWTVTSNVGTGTRQTSQVGNGTHDTGRILCTTAGVQLPSVAARSVTLKAKRSGTAAIAIGPSDVTFAAGVPATDGFLLEPGDSFTDNYSNTNLIFCRTATASKELSWAVSN